MKLSEQELRWLTRWEKRERQWVSLTRWVCLFNGVVFIASGIYLLNLLLASEDREVLALLFFPFFLIGGGGAWFGITFSKWRGDVRLRLFLRLIREHESKDASTT